MTSSAEMKPSFVLRAHWVWVLLLEVLTRGLFDMVWLVVLSRWVLKVRGRSAAYGWSIVFAGLLPELFVVGLLIGIGGVVLHLSHETILGLVKALAVVSLIVVRVFAVFTLRAELSEAPIGLWTGYWMTLIFGVAYLQFCLRRYAKRMASAGPSAVVGMEEVQV